MGLVLLVMPLVKLVTFPSTPAEKAWLPLITEAAKAEPGKLGMDMV
jgi:hypothetical protein